MTDDPLFIVVAIALLAVLGILMFGVGSFGVGAGDGKRSNRIMWWRIGAQAAAVVLILLFVLIRRGG